MLDRLLLSAALLAVAPLPTSVKFWPPWLSIESPVNPFAPGARDAVLLVHAAMRDGIPSANDVTATAEGLVNGARRSVVVRLDAMPTPGVFAVRRQWPTDGTWLLRIDLHPRGDTTTALVLFDREGNVTLSRVPTRLASGTQVPRPVSGREIDSTLTAAARR
jgi:hypothetical protein